jgi:PAS domain-containing protein
MGAHQPLRGEQPDRRAAPSPPGGLLDLLSVAAVVLDDQGKIVFWSPQADEVFGHTAEEALGQYAAHVLVHAEHRELAAKLFTEVMSTGASWAGAFPIRRKDGMRSGSPKCAARYSCHVSPSLTWWHCVKLLP